MHRSCVTWCTVAVGCLLAVTLAAESGTYTVPPDRALLIVRVPADAIITVDGRATQQKGAERTFATPPLAPGATYSYELVARWTVNGKEQTATRVVSFQSGQARVIDLTAGSRAISKKLPPEKKAAPAPEKKAAAPKTRSFLFTYAGRVTGLKPGEAAHVWLPRASSNAQQDVTVTALNLPGATAERLGKDQEYGNSILYFEGKADEKGEIPFEVVYKVLRREVQTDYQGNLYFPITSSEKVDRYLQPDSKVPIEGKPLEVLKENLKGKELPRGPFAAAKTLYDVVNHYMTYKKVGSGWGQGDVLWACDSRYGNCTDFHSLFISMARGNKIPAKFEMGFPLPPRHGAGTIPGYHCWAWFMPDGKGWIPVDISEANQHPDLAEYYFGNLSENRVSFSIGRDIELEPRQKGPAVNFLIYPYVEVAGKAYPAEKVQRSFSYKDLP